MGIVRINAGVEHVLLFPGQGSALRIKGVEDDLGDEFLSVIWNGAARSRTRPLGCFIGNLALTVYCKALNNMTANRPRIRQILRQCQFKAADSCKDGFHFSIDPSQVITPTTVNTRTGYSVTTINVEWRTTK